MPNPVRVRIYTESDAIHDSREAHVRPGHHIHIGLHPRRDMPEQTLAEITDCPPGARVDQREHLLSYMGISTFCNGEIGDDTLEWCVDSAVVQLILGVLHRSSFCPPPIDERLQRRYCISGLFMLRQDRFQPCLR